MRTAHAASAGIGGALRVFTTNRNEKMTQRRMKTGVVALTLLLASCGAMITPCTDYCTKAAKKTQPLNNQLTRHCGC